MEKWPLAFIEKVAPGLVPVIQELDRRMKSERGVDSAGELKLLLVWLAAERS